MSGALVAVALYVHKHEKSVGTLVEDGLHSTMNLSSGHDKVSEDGEWTSRAMSFMNAPMSREMAMTSSFAAPFVDVDGFEGEEGGGEEGGGSVDEVKAEESDEVEKELRRVASPPPPAPPSAPRPTISVHRHQRQQNVVSLSPPRTARASRVAPP